MAHRLSSNILRLRPTSSNITSSTHRQIPSIAPISISSLSRRPYASSSTDQNKKSDLQGLGEVGKGDKNARPVILEHAAPVDSKDPEVRKHNEEFEKRPDRAVNDDKSGKTADEAEKETGKKA